jgi:DNA-binding GntR family transcriptional regulator
MTQNWFCRRRSSLDGVGNSLSGTKNSATRSRVDVSPEPARAAAPSHLKASNGLGDSAVTRSHAQVLEMILGFELKPGDRVNESEIARKLGVSRTPLREALNRLVSEGFLVSQPSKGFFCRQVGPDEILQLYQLRCAVEVGAVRLAIARVTDEEIDGLQGFLNAQRAAAGPSRTDQLALDESFHERLLALSGNQEMMNVLRGVNRKIHAVRYIDLGAGGAEAREDEHKAIIAALRRRDAETCTGLLERHIHYLMGQIEGSLRRAYDEREDDRRACG